MNLIDKSAQIRERIIEKKFGLLASSLSCVEIMVALFYGYKQPFKFILSKGHASPTLYAILEDKGLLKWTDDLHTHPARSENITITSGSLGHGIGIGCGMAMVSKEPVFVLVGDGELYEGSCWESIMFAGHHALKNLICIVDNNGICATDRIYNVMTQENFQQIVQLFGWNNQWCDGHSPDEILFIIKNSIMLSLYSPKMLNAYTIKGKGVPSLENQDDCHLRCI